MVAFGMIGASISGVSFISVPGMVMGQQMTYLQTCMGFIIGYFVVAYVLLPIYYRMNLTTIYSYLDARLGRRSYLTGAWFFIISKLAGAALKFYVVCILLHTYIFADLGVPFFLTVPIMVLLIWLYTRRSGIKTLVWTDTLQTACMFLSLGLITYVTIRSLNMPLSDIWHQLTTSGYSQVFVMDDFSSTQNFWKQFISGIFIVIVMTGLDQDMMQKNLTCKTLRDAQKDMCSYGFAFLPVNALFLILGVLLCMLAQQEGMALPAKGDELLPMFAATGQLGNGVLVLFSLGLVATSFSTADSTLTALTTSFCVDVCRRTDDKRFRQQVHIAMAVVFVMAILLFDNIGSSSIINLIYTVVGYTYGPLLGLFAFGIFTRRNANDHFVPVICVLSPVLCYIISQIAKTNYDYTFGYELLMLNGIFTFVGLSLASPQTKTSP